MWEVLETLMILAAGFVSVGYFAALSFALHVARKEPEFGQRLILGLGMTCWVLAVGWVYFLLR